MKLQYSASSARGSGQQKFRRTYSQQGYGLLTVSWIDRFFDEAIRFSVNPLIIKKLMRVVLFVVPAALICNLICSVMIHGLESDIEMLNRQRAALETTNVTLLAKRAMAFGPDNMEKLAKEKLNLVRAEKGQVGVFDYRYGFFRY